MLSRTNWGLVVVFASIGVAFFTELGVLASLLVAAAVAFIVFVPLRSVVPETRRLSYATGMRPTAWLLGAVVFAAGVGVMHVVGEPVYHYDCPWRAYGNCKTAHNWATVIYFAGVGGATVAASYYGRYRLFRDGEETAARDVHQGKVVVSGEVGVCDETVRTPFTDEETVCYRYAVQERHNSRLFADGGSWHTVEMDEEGVPFYVEDGSGRVLVDPADAELTLNRVTEFGKVGDTTVDDIETAEDSEIAEAVVSSGGVYTVDAEMEVASDDEPPASVSEWEGENNGYLPLLPRDRRYTEDHLRPGDTVVVAGKAERVVEGYPERTVVGADGAPAKIAVGDETDVTAWITGAVWVGGAIGAVLAPLGFILMLVTL